MAELIKKYRGLLLYGIFGVLTTLINLAVYYICYEKSGIPNIPSTVIAWVVAVAFAFVTNKIWVFDSKSMDVKTLLYEATTFVGCRLATGVFELVVMYVTVDLLQVNGMLMKLIVNVVVIVLNYVASKLVIFKKKDI